MGARAGAVAKMRARAGARSISTGVLLVRSSVMLLGGGPGLQTLSILSSIFSFHTTYVTHQTEGCTFLFRWRNNSIFRNHMISVHSSLYHSTIISLTNATYTKDIVERKVIPEILVVVKE